MQGEDTMPGGTDEVDEVDKVQGDAARDMDANTVDVYHLLS
jgi:hypothetical protein